MYCQTQQHHQYKLTPLKIGSGPVNHTLKCCWRVLHAERHLFILVKSLWSYKGRYLLSPWSKWHLPVTFKQVKFTYVLLA